MRYRYFLGVKWFAADVCRRRRTSIRPRNPWAGMWTSP